MRVKWSRNLDVPAQQRGGQASARESSKDERRKSFLHIFKFRDRKSEDERRKGSEAEIQPPKEVVEGKARKTVTFADQQSPGTSVVCNRKGRRVSADAVDMTVFKVSKNDSLNKPQSSRTSIERSPLFKRTDDGTLPEKKQSEVERNKVQQSKPKFATVEKLTSSDVGKAPDTPASRTVESEVRSQSARNKTDLSRTSGKSDGSCNDDEQKPGSKIPILLSKESFSVAKDVFKSDFWSNNIEIAAKTQPPLSSKLGLENDHTNSERYKNIRKELLQATSKKEEDKRAEEVLRSKIPVSESVSCKDSKIKAVSEKSYRQICLGEAVTPHYLSPENNKHEPIKATVYSPVGYCGISKLVLPKVVVNDNVPSYGGGNFRKESRLQGIGSLRRFESKEPLSCQNKLPLKNDPSTDKRDVKPKEEVSSQETISENKSDCPTREDRRASNEVVDSDDIVSAPAESESGKVTSLPKVPTDKASDALTATATTGENICHEKPLLNTESSEKGKSVENEHSKCSLTESNAADQSAADVKTEEGAAETEKNRAIVSTAAEGVVIENNDKEIPVKENSLSPLCLQPPNNSFCCLNEIILTKEVKDKIILASNAPVPVKSGIENMRNLLDASVIIVNHRELSSKPWICNIFTPREPKRSCFENSFVCDKDPPSRRAMKDSYIKFGKTKESSSSSSEDEMNIGKIILIQNDISVEPKRALEMPSCDHRAEDTFLPAEIGDTQHKITEQVADSDSSKEAEHQDTICKLIEDDNVAFIDEHADTSEEISSDSDKEMKSGTLTPALSTATANGAISSLSSGITPETNFECQDEVSKGIGSCQQGVPEVCSVEHPAYDGGTIETSKYDSASDDCVLQTPVKE